MKKIPLLLLMIVTTLSLSAMKKKATHYVKYVSGTFSNNEGAIRKVGCVYEFVINTCTDNVIIDSVWFGATPVPCDLLEITSRHKTDLANTKGMYIVRANKDVYKNFNAQVDSTLSYAAFKAPFVFKGDAVIMYKVNGKRYYVNVTNVKEVKAKGYR